MKCTQQGAITGSGAIIARGQSLSHRYITDRQLPNKGRLFLSTKLAQPHFRMEIDYKPEVRIVWSGG